MSTDILIRLLGKDQATPQIKAVQAALTGMESTAARLKPALAAVAATLGVGFSATVIVSALRNAVDGLDQLNDVADATGSSIEKISALEGVALRTGTSVDTLAGTLVRLNQTLAGATAGSEAERIFTALGLSVAELKREDPADVLVTVSRALSQFADDGEKARAVQVLFGKSVREVAPLLKDLAEAGQLNATATAEQAAQADAFNKQLFALGANARQAARVLVGELLPGLNRYLGEFRAGVEAFGGPLSAALSLGTEMPGSALERLDVWRQKLADLKKQRDIIAADPNPIARRGGLIDIDAEIAKAQKFEQYYRSVFLMTAPDLGQTDPRELARRGRGPRGSLVVPPGGGGGSRGGRGSGSELGDYNPYGLFVGPNFDDFIGPEIDGAVLKAREQMRRELESIISRSDASQLEEVAQNARDLAAAWNEGTISAEELRRGVEVLGRDFDKLAPKVEETLGTINEFGLQAARNIQNALGDTLERALAGNFRSIGQMWVDLLRDMAAQAMAAQLNKLLFGDVMSGGSDSGILGAALRALGASFGGARASGGPVAPGRTYLVGERGPELLRMGSTGGTVIPNGAIGGATYSPTIIVNGDVGPATVALVEQAIARERARWQRRAYVEGA